MLTRAAAVIPRLQDGRVLVGRRTLAARSFPGALAFPGGVVDDDDTRLPRASGVGHEGAERACALRELGEETGRWLVVHADTHAPPRAAIRDTFTAALHEGAPLGEALDRTGLVLDDRALIPLGRWVTPDFLPRRFDVRQFLLPLDAEPPPSKPPTDELEDIEFVRPRVVHEAWQRGDALLVPPIRFIVTGLVDAEDRELDEGALVRALSQVPGPHEPELRDVIAGIAVQPYRTPTLPPATHTNTILLGAGDFLLIDPATPYDDERARFDDLLRWLREAKSRRPMAVVLTHHHPDHVGDAARVAAQYRLPVWAHRETAARIDLEVNRFLDEGDFIELPGFPPRRVRVLFTPGHARGHLCFLEEHTGVLVAGDMVASEGSILIDPPEGHMGTYLVSLARLHAEGPRRVVPSHGPLLADGTARLAEHLHHRAGRQRKLLAALPTTGAGLCVDELVPLLYGGQIPEEAFPLAARSVFACITLLVEQGAAVEHDMRYRRLLSDDEASRFF